MTTTILTWKQIAALNTPRRGSLQDIAARYGGIDYECLPARFGDYLLFTTADGMVTCAMQEPDGSWRECTVAEIAQLEATTRESQQ